MLDKKIIGKKLKELRKARGFRQNEVAERVGLSRATVSNVEIGKRGLSLDSLKRFCELYNVDISYFGITTDSYNEAVDLTERLKTLFNSPNVDTEVKEKLYTDIMELYLKMRKS